MFIFPQQIWVTCIGQFNIPYILNIGGWKIKYTDKNIIHSPFDPELKEAIDKRCYFGYTIEEILKEANSNVLAKGTLKKVEWNRAFPFVVENNGYSYNYSYIIKEM